MITKTSEFLIASNQTGHPCPPHD